PFLTNSVNAAAMRTVRARKEPPQLEADVAMQQMVFGNLVFLVRLRSSRLPSRLVSQTLIEMVTTVAKRRRLRTTCIGSQDVWLMRPGIACTFSGETLIDQSALISAENPRHPPTLNLRVAQKALPI